MTKLICCFLVIVISSLAAPLIAQFKEIPPAKEINSISAAGYGSFGLGIGLPYGGLGVNLAIMFLTGSTHFSVWDIIS